MVRFTSLALLLAASAGGCASNDQIAPTSLEYDDLALSVGSTVAKPELGAVGDVVAIAHGQLPQGFVTGADGAFTGTHVGLGYRYTLLCHSAQGDAAPCDGTTDSVVAQVSWTGGLELPDTGMQFQRTGPWAVSGLTRSVATASGTATLAYDSRVANPDRGDVSTYHLDYNATYDEVSYDMTRLVAIGGSISYAIAVDRATKGTNRDSARHYDVAATVTFVGAGVATMDLDGAQQYKLELATGAVVRI